MKYWITQNLVTLSPLNVVKDIICLALMYVCVWRLVCGQEKPPLVKVATYVSYTVTYVGICTCVYAHKVN